MSWVNYPDNVYHPSELSEYVACYSYKECLCFCSEAHDLH